MAVVAGAAVLGFLAYDFVVTPYLEERAQLATDLATQKKAVQTADTLLRNWGASTRNGRP